MAKANVLIVDPSATSVAKLVPLLRSRGHTVTVCDNPLTAVHEFHDNLKAETPFTFVLCRDDLGPDYTERGMKKRFEGTELVRALNNASRVIPVDDHPVFIGGCIKRGSWHTLGPLNGWFEELPLIGDTPEQLEWNPDAISSIMDILGYLDESQPRNLLPA